LFIDKTNGWQPAAYNWQLEARGYLWLFKNMQVAGCNLPKGRSQDKSNYLKRNLVLIFGKNIYFNSFSETFPKIKTFSETFPKIKIDFFFHLP